MEFYWAADYPALDRLKLAEDSTWYVSVMRQGQWAAERERPGLVR